MISTTAHAKDPVSNVVNVNLSTNNLLYQRQAEQKRIIAQKNIGHNHNHAHKSKPKLADITNRQIALLQQDCLPYKSVHITGARLIDAKQFEPKVGDCINELQLNKINRAIIKAYLKKGYAQARTSFGTSNNKTSLIIAVNEGVVANVRSDKKDVNAKTLLPNVVGRPLKIADIDQAIDHTGMLQGSRSKVDIYPNKNGTIDIELSSTASKPVSGEVSIDNSGSDSTGKWVGSFVTRVDSPLNVSDSLVISGSESLKGMKSSLKKHHNSGIKKQSKSLAVNYTVPYGYWKFGTYGAIDNYEHPVILPKSGAVKQSGNGQQVGLTTEYTFSRGSKHIAKITGSIEQTKKNSYFADSRVEVQSPIVNSAKVGINSTLIRPNGMIFVDGFYEKGIDKSKVNVTNDSYNLYGVNADAYFYHGKLDTVDGTWRNQHKLKVLHGNDTLPSIKQSNLLSPSSVRGFNNVSSNANTSASLQSTVFVTTHYKNWELEPYVGIDFAFNKDKENGNKKALGGAVGLVASHTSKNEKTITAAKDYEMTLEYGKGKILEKDKKKEAETNEDVSMKLKWLF